MPTFLVHIWVHTRLDDYEYTTAWPPRRPVYRLPDARQGGLLPLPPAAAAAAVVRGPRGLLESLHPARVRLGVDVSIIFARPAYFLERITKEIYRVVFK